MINYVEGLSDTDDINFCSRCGQKIGSWSADGTGTCECGFRFAVLEIPFNMDEEGKNGEE